MIGYLSEIRFFAGSFSPDNWAFCNGQLLEIASYPDLYDLIGTTYGGDGTNTFALPDLRGRSAVGQGQGNNLSAYTLGEMIGATEVALSAGNLPPHTHEPLSSFTATATPRCNTSAGTTDEPPNNYMTLASNGAKMYNAGGLERMAPTHITVSGDVTCGTTGKGEAHINVQPSLVSSYIICISGLKPVQG